MGAVLDSIWFHGSNLQENTMSVYAKLHPAGKLDIDVVVPEPLRQAILRLANAAVELKQAQMEAHLLGEKTLTEIGAKDGQDQK